MSLEDAIKELTEAMKANTKALGGGGTPNKAAGKPAAGAKAVTLDTVAKRYGAYMSAEGDDGKANVRKVLKHFNVKKLSDMAEGQYAESLELLDQLEAGEDPFGGGEDDLM